MNISTEGVLILASAKKLAEEYKDKSFNYDFPEGLSKLLDENSIIALTTSDGDNIVLEILPDEVKLIGDFDKIITQWIELKSEDEILVLSHAEFTGICTKKGDYRIYGWPVKKIANKEEGVYKIKIGVDDFRDNFDEIQAYFRLTISISRSEEKETNQVTETAF
jgi:hypothetical protein